MAKIKKKKQASKCPKKRVRKLHVSKKRSVISLNSKLNKIKTSIDLRTTCPGHCVCCNVACPQMNYSEFLSIATYIYNDLPEEERIVILQKSIKYFFSMSLIKPCPLLVGTKCSVYDIRPLSCRIYGLWPEDMYNERVEGFCESTGLSKEEVPLNTQCKYVKRMDNSKPLTKKIIEGVYDKINLLDKEIGDFNDEQIKKRYNQRTWHDWFMVKIFGEDTLSSLTGFLLAAEANEVEDFTKELILQVQVVGDLIFRKGIDNA